MTTENNMITDACAYTADMDTDTLGDAFAAWVALLDGEDETIETMRARDDLTEDQRAWLEDFAATYAAAEARESGLSDFNGNVEKLADAFVVEIRAEVGFFDLIAIDRINAERNDMTCATHDFCDANMPMDAAFTKVFGRSILPEDGEMADADCDLWNAAWSRAKALGFSPTTRAKNAVERVKASPEDTAEAMKALEEAMAELREIERV